MILQMSLDSLFQLVLICGQDPLSHAGNFLSLVEEGFYDGIHFHRVIKDFMLQVCRPAVT